MEDDQYGSKRTTGTDGNWIKANNRKHAPRDAWWEGNA